MNISDLKNGRRYEIARPVKNSKLDKRERYSPGQLFWTVGDRFRWNYWGKSNSGQLEGLQLAATPRRVIGGVYTEHPDFEALVTALDEVPEEPKDILVAAGLTANDGDDVLALLVQHGKLTLDDIRVAAIAVHAREEAEDAAKLAARGMCPHSFKWGECPHEEPSCNSAGHILVDALTGTLHGGTP